MTAASAPPRVAVITGAAGGIGAATAREFARTGARLVLGDVRGAELEVRRERLARAGATIPTAATSSTRLRLTPAGSPPAVLRPNLLSIVSVSKPINRNA